MRLLVDTDIAIDCLLERDPYYEPAYLLIMLGRAHEFDLWIGVNQLSDLIYPLTQGGKRSYTNYARNSLKWLREAVRICPLGEPEADECLESDWEDLEDALVYQAARTIKADAIITRNQKDFARSRIPVFDCEEFFTWLRETKDIDYSYIVS